MMFFAQESSNKVCRRKLPDGTSQAIKKHFLYCVHLIWNVAAQYLIPDADILLFAVSTPLSGQKSFFTASRQNRAVFSVKKSISAKKRLRVANQLLSSSAAYEMLIEERTGFHHLGRPKMSSSGTMFGRS